MSYDPSMANKNSLTISGHNPNLITFYYGEPHDHPTTALPEHDGIDPPAVYMDLEKGKSVSTCPTETTAKSEHSMRRQYRCRRVGFAFLGFLLLIVVLIPLKRNVRKLGKPRNGSSLPSIYLSSNQDESPSLTPAMKSSTLRSCPPTPVRQTLSTFSPWFSINPCP